MTELVFYGGVLRTELGIGLRGDIFQRRIRDVDIADM